MKNRLKGLGTKLNAVDENNTSNIAANDDIPKESNPI